MKFLTPFLILALCSPIFAQELVEVIPPKTKIVSPKSIPTFVFTVVNCGKTEDIYKLQATLPEDWALISTLEPISLKGTERRKVPVTVFVPETAPYDIEYPISLAVTSEANPQINSTAKVIIRVSQIVGVKVLAPQGQEANPGEEITYFFVVVNRGNGSDRFKVQAKSSHKWRIEFSEELIGLRASEKRRVVVNLYIPKEISQTTRDCLTFKVASTKNPEVFDEVRIYTTVIPLPKKESIYRTFPSQIRLDLGKAKPRMEFHLGGYITEKSWLDLRYHTIYQQPGFFRLDFAKDPWDVGLGDTRVHFTSLTQPFLTGRGIKFHIKQKHFEGTLFWGTKYYDYKEKSLGLNLTAKINKANLGLNYLSLEDKRKMFSLEAKYELTDGFSFSGEYASGHTEGASLDKAWRFTSDLVKDRLNFRISYIKAGTKYPGARSDTEGYSGYLGYRVFPKVWLWLSREHHHNNIEKDTSLPIITKDRTRIGSSFSFLSFPTMSLFYQLEEERSDPASFANQRRKSIGLKLHKSFKVLPIHLSLEENMSEDYDEIYPTQNYKETKRRAWLSGHKERALGWIGYTESTKEDTLGYEEKITTEELGIQYPLFKNCLTTLRIARQTQEGETYNIYSLKIAYQLRPDTILSLEVKKDKEMQWGTGLTVTSKFEIPLLFMPIKGRVEGLVFIDENNNGQFDKNEKGLKGVMVKINGARSFTSEKGVFLFSTIEPGEYNLTIDEVSLPIGFLPHQRLPYRLRIVKGKTKEIEIPLVQTGKIRGVVFKDTNRNGKREEEEIGVAGVRVVLKVGERRVAEAFSEADGGWTFSPVLPGEYKIILDKGWLPERYILTTPGKYSISLNSGEELSQINFGAMEKNRRIIKTFSG